MIEPLVSLTRAFEKRGTFDVDGSPYGIWLIELRNPAEAMIVSFGARSGQHGTRSYTGELHLGRDNYTDAEIVDLAVDTMRRIISGELPPGARELL